MHMGFLIVLALLILSTWLIYATLRRLRRYHAGLSWWIISLSLFLVGFALGIWFAFFFEYQPFPKLRVFSFPLPLAFFVWEEDRWTDFVTPPAVMYPGLAANVVTTVALALFPVFLSSLFARRERRSHENTHAAFTSDL